METPPEIRSSKKSVGNFPSEIMPVFRGKRYAADLDCKPVNSDSILSQIRPQTMQVFRLLSPHDSITHRVPCYHFMRGCFS